MALTTARYSGIWALGAELLGVTPGSNFNACERVLDRHCELRGNEAAFTQRDHSGRRSVTTFIQLRDLAAKVASVLDGLGHSRGDRVFALLEPSVELHATVLGAVRVGAVAGPLFSAFGTEAIRERLADCGAKVLVTSAQHLPKVRSLLAQVPSLTTILVVGPVDFPLGHIEERWDTLVGPASADRSPSATNVTDPLLIHYTSGTTGRPKGALHVQEALIGHAATARLVLDLNPGDVYWCTADPGWVTGTSYGIFGPLALGIGVVVFSGGFASDAWYRTIQEEGVTNWYTSPTALRMLMREGTTMARRFDLSSLRHICSVGEPLNPAVIEWGREAFSLTIHDTWWQTETGCMQIVNRPGLPVKAGSMGKPLEGVQAAILNADTLEVLQPGSEGLLALRYPWPSMFRTYWAREELYASRFRNGWYLSGDRARCDQDGYYWFIARDDDVINTSGHLVGPFEIESALLTNGGVAEAAAFGVPDLAAGERVVVKVVLREGIAASKEIERHLRTAVRRSVGPYAVPREIIFELKLPRTRSGKIMRRVAKAQFLGLPIGDVSGLED